MSLLMKTIAQVKVTASLMDNSLGMNASSISERRGR